MSIGIWQVVLVLLIVLILFGAGKLPKVMGDVASGVKNFTASVPSRNWRVSFVSRARMRTTLPSTTAAGSSKAMLVMAAAV